MNFSFFLTAIGVQLQVMQDRIHQCLQILLSLHLQPASIPTGLYLCCFLAPLFHLLFMVFSCISTSPLFNSSSSSGAFYLLFITQITSQFLCIPALFCPCKLPHYCAPTVVWDLSTPEEGFLLSSLCSAQHQVTHRTRQGFILYSGGLEPGHRGSISHVFLHLWQAKKQ